MVMILFPLPVSSALLLEIRASRRCLASIGEVSAAPEDAPMRAVFSAREDSAGHADNNPGRKVHRLAGE